ncbi:uncharacterized protein SETTUDRAFT_34210 [Exserohilum turcica Et28A]|uniref:Uncharacterized protein n=1 Tax=Exserohilum turcicum (strain 28A) TaxID=671987 RepID=R0K2R8_EXST2|nr:uncharacterized protein SETTUDRAFT_34210 [Exserohilum turcica Et28A]EOA82667.1 hypothetical protein SETTUDRAFT_34210 [Exserohilum turcica Et28A]
MRAKTHDHETTDWFASYDCWLYDIDYSLWLHQKDIAVLRGNIHKMRSALPTNAGDYLRKDDNQTLHAEMDDTLDQDGSQAQALDLAKSPRLNSFLSELTEASNRNIDEITVHTIERERSTASDSNVSDTHVKASGVEGDRASPQKLESAIRMGLAERSGLAKKGLLKQRIGHRRSPRRHRQI